MRSRYPTALIAGFASKKSGKCLGLGGHDEVYGHNNGIFILIVTVSCGLASISPKPVAQHQ